ncbi:MAG: hypothetical protein CL661_11145 [Bacteroidetes bacterium]|nr:hypothetical protein [Bacteroidota bacterium]
MVAGCHNNCISFKTFYGFYLGNYFPTCSDVEDKKILTVILLLFWLNIIAFSSAFGELIDDVKTETGTIEVVNTMNIDATYLIIMAIILAFILYKIGMMNGKLIKYSLYSQNLISIQLRIIFFVSILLIPWLLVVILSGLLRADFFSISLILTNLPAIILLIPFLVREKPENLNFKYVSTNGSSISDLILVIFLIILSLVLILVMRNGIVILG